MPAAVRILIVDDEPHVRASLAAWFRDEGYLVGVAAGGKEALDALARDGADILLVDIKMPGMDGLELQRRVRELAPEATVVIMTAFAAVETAVQALKEGAYDYIVKPFDPEGVSRLVRKAAERYSLLAENRALRERLEAATPRLISAGRGAMAQVFEQIDQVAPTDTSVLISGESGTGKELLARTIHARSGRRFGPMVVMNCAALAEGVLESELFGHERGAFTGAVARRRGKIELAHEGTLFLDEVGDIPLKVQVDLLRVLEERSVTRVGGNAAVSTNFRLLTATHRDLDAERVADHSGLSAAASSTRGPGIREDFYFRINVFRIHLPPLRERPEDIRLLAEHFLRHYSAQMGRRIEGLSEEAMAALAAHSWPGNVRELANAIERACVVCRSGRVLASHFPFHGGVAEPDLSLAAAEELHVRRVLASCAYNVSHAARALGVDRVTLYNKMKKYKIERP
jgi:two-component system response regulator HydG